MKKAIVLFLTVTTLLFTISTSYSWRDSRGYQDKPYHHNYSQNRGRHHYNYWRDVGAGLYILGGIVALEILTSPIYYAPPRHYGTCTKEVRYGYWEYDSFGQRHWIATHVEYEPVPCY